MLDLFEDGLPGSDLYTDIQEIGHGRFSEVYRAKEKSSGRQVALKHMLVDEPGTLTAHVLQEISALRSIQHPNVVKTLGIHQQGIGVALVLELCITDLRQLLGILAGNPLEPAVAKGVMQQLLQALAACHDAENCGLIRLADFGMAHNFCATHAENVSGSPPRLSHQVGTRWYKAPELIFSSRHYNCAVDLWSAGCIFAELLSGQALFPGETDIDQICRINKVLGSISEADWPGVVDLPDWGKLAFPDSKGTGLSKALPHVSSAALDLLQGLLRYNPDCRLTTSAALAAPYFQQDPAPSGPETIAILVKQLLCDYKEKQQNCNVHPVFNCH